MRILQVGPIPPHIGGVTTGGVATHLWGLSTNLAKSGHQVGILANNYHSYQRKIKVDANDLIIYGLARPVREVVTSRILQPVFWKKVILTKNHFGTFLNWQSVVRNLLAYQRAIDRFQPAVIHVHNLEYRFPFALFSAGRKTPIIITVQSTHSFEFVNPRVKKLVQKNLRLADNLIFVSNFVRDKFVSLFPYDLIQKRIYTVYNPVDSSSYYPIPREEAARALSKSLATPLILFVGNLIQRKGAQILVEAAAKLKSKGMDFKVYIVGDGPQRPELNALIQEYDLTEYVSLEGHKQYPDLLYYYNLADVLALPSSSEGFSLVILEALACGCPVVGAAESVSEAISSDRLGYKCEAAVSSLAGQLEKALNNTWDRNFIAEHARKYSWQHKVPSFEAIYDEVISGEQGKRLL